MKNNKNPSVINHWKSVIDSDRATPDDIVSIISALDKGEIRVAEEKNGSWLIHAWVKKAIVQYFGITTVAETSAGDLRFRDKIPLKENISHLRIVPGGNSIRFGSFLEEQVVMMPPSFVNIGARVGARTMIDSNALVGSCAQIGSDVHLSAGVQIGGVLEPANARPVIIENGAFIGAGAIIVEGVLVREEAIIAPGVVLSSGTKILEIDHNGQILKEHFNEIPQRAIVIPGARKRDQVLFQTPIIAGYKTPNTQAKVALSSFLRQF